MKSEASEARKQKAQVKPDLDSHIACWLIIGLLISGGTPAFLRGRPAIRFRMTS